MAERIDRIGGLAIRVFEVDCWIVTVDSESQVLGPGPVGGSGLPGPGQKSNDGLGTASGPSPDRNSTKFGFCGEYSGGASGDGAPGGLGSRIDHLTPQLLDLKWR